MTRPQPEVLHYVDPFDDSQHTLIDPPLDGPICDFCSSRPVVWSYPTATFELNAHARIHDPRVLRERSVGNWAACDPCHDLIEADRRIALANRSMSHFPLDEMPGIDERTMTAIREHIIALHCQFFDSRNGDATRVAERG